MSHAVLSKYAITRYLHNTSWLLVEKLLRLIAGVFVGAYMAKYLGPEEFGILNYAISFSALFSTLATFGLENILIRELVKTPENHSTLVGTSFAIMLASSTLSILVIYSLLPLTSNTADENLYILLIASSFLLQSLNVIPFFFIARVESKYATIPSIFWLIVGSLIRLLFVAIHKPLPWFIALIVLDSFFVAAINCMTYVWKKFSFSRWHFDFTVARHLIRDSLPLVLSGLIVSVYMKIDQIMLKEMVSADSVGYYAAAARISEASYFIPAIISSSIFPALIRAQSTNPSAYHTQLQLLYNLMLSLSLAIALVLFLMANPIINILYGNKFTPAAGVLTIHAWAAVAVFLGIVSNRQLVAENHQRISAYRTSIGCVANIILNLLLIPKEGIQGAAWATVISYFIATLSIGLFPSSRRQILFYLRALNLRQSIRSVFQLFFRT